MSGDGSERLERSFLGLDRDQVLRFAAGLARIVSRAGAPQSVTIGLGGELGAGKTTFAQGFVGALPGARPESVTSPTYAIVQNYDTTPPVRHADLYRIGSMEELDAIGFAEAMAEPGLNLVEWYGRVPDALPEERLEIELAGGPDDVRDIRARAHGARVVPLLRSAPKP
ncbi:MAG: tRNA (adenosine(37)-N6)-threonylcarbamoyltransferase complex ATPase subunit type 1 TsaE [Myxococcota bacterium]